MSSMRRCFSCLLRCSGIAITSLTTAFYPARCTAATAPTERKAGRPIVSPAQTSEPTDTTARTLATAKAGCFSPGLHSLDGLLPLATLTNSMAVMDLVVEARCVELTEHWRRATRSGSATNGWARGGVLTGLTPADIRFEIAPLFNDAYGVTPEEWLEIMLSRLAIVRGIASIHMVGLREYRQPPYETLIASRMGESEKRVFALLQTHFRAVLLREAAALMMDSIRQSQDKETIISLQELLNGASEAGRAQEERGR